MDNSILLSRVRWAIRIVIGTTLLGVLLALFLAVKLARQDAIISANVGRLCQLQLAVENTIESSGCPFTAATPNETWKQIVTREAVDDTESVSTIFIAHFASKQGESDIVAIRLPGESQQDCVASYELICMERPELFVPLDAAAIFTVDDFCDQAEALLRQRPDAAVSYVIVAQFGQSPEVKTLGEYVERLR